MKARKPFLISLAFALLASIFTLGGINAVQASAEENAHSACADYCLVCDLAEKINALPDSADITVENAAETIQRIHDIDRIKYDLTDEEFDELTQLVEVDTTGYGVGKITKYYAAIDALNGLDRGVSFQISKMIVLDGESVSDTSAAEVAFEIVNLDTDKTTQLTMFDLSTPYSEYGADKYELTADGWSFTYLLPAGTYRITEVNTDQAVSINGKTWNHPQVTIEQNGQTVKGNSTVITLTEGNAASVLFGNYYSTVTYNFVDEEGAPLTEEVVISGPDFADSTSIIGSAEYIQPAETGGTLTLESVPTGYCLPDPISYTVPANDVATFGNLTIDGTDPNAVIFTWKLVKHAYGTLIAEVPATCENGGTKAHHYCATCETYFDENKNKVEFEDLAIPAGEHEYGALIAESPATCDTAGVSAHYQCAVCEKYFDEEKNEVAYEELTIPATGHEYGEWTETKAPSATEEGERERKCLHCDEVQTEKIPVTPVEYNPPSLLLFAIVVLLILAILLFILFKD